MSSTILVIGTGLISNPEKVKQAIQVVKDTALLRMCDRANFIKEDIKACLAFAAEREKKLFVASL